MALFEIIVIVAAVALIYIIWSLWQRMRVVDTDPTAPASDIYNLMAKNDSNPFNLMIDFKQPVDKEGPEGTETSTIETFKFS